MAPRSSADTLSGFAARVLIAILLVALAGLVWYAGRILLLVFGAILLAILLRHLAELLSKRTPIPSGWALALVLLALAAFSALVMWLLGARIVAEFADLQQRIPQGLQRLQDVADQFPWVQRLLEELRSIDASRVGGAALQRLGGIASSMAFALAALAAIVFLGIYLAADPHRYIGGLLALVPARRRERARQLFETTGNALWLWLLGQFAAMLGVGVLITLGLMLLGIPGAVALGLIAGVLEFIPIVGPLIAAIPAVLIAFNQDPMTAAYVAILYLVVQQLEGYVIQPLVQERAVSLPPAIVLGAIVIAGMLMGLLGAALATPLAVLITVWLKMLYVEDILEEPTEVPGTTQPASADAARAVRRRSS